MAVREVTWALPTRNGVALLPLHACRTGVERQSNIHGAMRHSPDRLPWPFALAALRLPTLPERQFLVSFPIQAENHVKWNHAASGQMGPGRWYARAIDRTSPSLPAYHPAVSTGSRASLHEDSVRGIVARQPDGLSSGSPTPSTTGSAIARTRTQFEENPTSWQPFAPVSRPPPKKRVAA